MQQIFSYISAHWMEGAIWLLTFGEKAELLEPGEIRRELAEKIKRMGETYGLH